MKIARYAWIGMVVIFIALALWLGHALMQHDPSPAAHPPQIISKSKMVVPRNLLPRNIVAENITKAEKNSAHGVDKTNSPEKIQQILDEIHDASVTYSADALILIEPYLLHADAGVRRAAIEGMIVLGEKGAGQLMRAAAVKAPTPQDAVALLEAADYVELPSATGIFKKKKSSSAEKK